MFKVLFITITLQGVHTVVAEFQSEVAATEAKEKAERDRRVSAVLLF